MSQNNIELMRKALAFALVCDMVRTSLSNIGSVNTADGSKLATIVFDEVVSAIKVQQSA